MFLQRRSSLVVVLMLKQSKYLTWARNLAWR